MPKPGEVKKHNGVVQLMQQVDSPTPLAMGLDEQREDNSRFPGATSQ